MRPWQKWTLIILTLFLIPIMYFENQYFMKEQFKQSQKNMQQATLSAFNDQASGQYAAFKIYAAVKPHGKIYYFIPQNQNGTLIDLQKQEVKLGNQLYKKARTESPDISRVTLYVSYTANNLQDNTYAFKPTAEAYGFVKSRFKTRYQRLFSQTGTEAIYDMQHNTAAVSFKDLQKDSTTIPMIRQLAIDQQLQTHDYTPEQLAQLEALNFPRNDQATNFVFTTDGLTLKFAKNPLGIETIALPMATVGPYLNPDLVPEDNQVPSKKAGAKKIALTFNTTLKPSAITHIIDQLNDLNIKATFFTTGKAAKKHPEQLKQLLKAGHVVGTQSYNNDDDLDTMTAPEIAANLKQTDAAYFKASGQLPHLLRVTTETPSQDLTATASRALIAWSVDSEDWRLTIDAPTIAKNVNDRITGGDIVLLHTSDATIAALPAIVKEQTAHKRHFVTVNELFKQRLTPYQQYFKAGDQRLLQ
ncbi:polysaccharide deacetylase family protein [Lactobacillus curvatus]|nr:polysaccharide deacetylase family protein [Latilactobacillus curvatus]MSE24084.1 polysaccharide deacetylase family protein [Latilactobacillus curvatus]